jgi:ribulose-phosphate 3-epimerase
MIMAPLVVKKQDKVTNKKLFLCKSTAMSHHLIIPSILTADFLHLEKEIGMLNRSEADLIHLDIMDGVFVPNLTFGFPVIRQIRSVATKPLDVHLMIVHPDRYIREYRDAVCVNPHTDVSLLEPILGDLNMVLVMTVNPGFGGQTFIEGSYAKIRKLRKMIDESGAGTLIEVDGGVTEENIGSLIEAGVDVFVVGNTVFSAEDPLYMISQLKNHP